MDQKTDLSNVCFHFGTNHGANSINRLNQNEMAENLMRLDACACQTEHGTATSFDQKYISVMVVALRL